MSNHLELCRAAAERRKELGLLNDDADFRAGWQAAREATQRGLRSELYRMPCHLAQDNRLMVETVEVLHLLDDPDCGCKDHSGRDTSSWYGTGRPVACECPRRERRAMDGICLFCAGRWEER